MIRIDIDLEELENYPSDRLPTFVERLLATIPSLHEHRCSYNEPGGFVRRLYEGTWMGHIIEHMAIELQCLAGTSVGRGKTRSMEQDGQYSVVYEFGEEEVGLRAGQIAFNLARYLLPADIPGAFSEAERLAFDFQREMEDLIRLAKDKALGPSTASLVAAAEARDIPWIRLNEFSLVQFGQGKYQKRIEATTTSLTSHIGVEIAKDKDLTNRLLRDAGLPVPSQRLVRDEEEAVRAAEDLGYPVVTKPYDGNHGRGVTLNLQNEKEVREGYRIAIAEGEPIVVERYLTGRDFRILVVGGKVVAVAERVPGHVVGDGGSTIQQLIDKVNADPRRGIGHERILTRLEIDEQAMWMLNRAGKALTSVLAAGEVFYLRLTGNLSTGGTAIDRTDEIHYENIQIAERAIQIIGLDIGGVDFITPDISRPVSEVGGGIVEINAGPGFRMHVAPSQGQSRDVAGKVIDLLFPPGTPARVPLCSITATNGKTTTTRMVGHIMKMTGATVGMTTTDGIYVDGERILSGDMTGPWSARVILREPRVDIAVLETARGGILREGLGFDRCDVGCVLNVQGDHLGIGGINTLEDLALIKQVVIEAVGRHGWGVLNADDPMTVSMAEACDGRICWFSMNPRNELVREHVRRGGRAFVLEEGVNGEMLMLYDEGRQIPLLWAHLIPATYEGHARFNTANGLAAAAVAYCMGANVEIIRMGLKTFNTTFFQVPGRMNVFEEYPFRVIFDYAHNPPAMRAMGEFVRNMGIVGKRIGVIGAPGDRRDSDIIALGKLAAGIFDRLIIREDWNRRGRENGAVAQILRGAAIDAGHNPDDIEIIVDEFDAIRTALDSAGSSDLIVIFADDVTNAWKLLTRYRNPEAYRRWLEDMRQPIPTQGKIGWLGAQ